MRLRIREFRILIYPSPFYCLLAFVMRIAVKLQVMSPTDHSCVEAVQAFESTGT